jgi:hypothetical protein
MHANLIFVDYNGLILALVCMGVKHGLVTLREEHRLRLFEKNI